ncbi:MAG: hypothetical protein E7189_06630 [Erysipelotrichaceae bacterium]|nr:hypothetical protein [Erysipelotrichaceae bacterium]
MKNKYFVDRMTYTLHDSPIEGQKEYWEEDINPIVIRTNDIAEAKRIYREEVQSCKDKYAEVILFKSSSDEDEIIDKFSTLDNDIFIRI